VRVKSVFLGKAREIVMRDRIGVVGCGMRIREEDSRRAWREEGRFVSFMKV